jgi:hypothetical protein
MSIGGLPERSRTMRARIISIALLLTVGVATPDAGTPAEEAKQAETPAREQAKDEPEAETAFSPVEEPILIAAMPVFVPPNRGSPFARLGGATRGTGTNDLPRIEALVPEEAGWTLEEQPVLYWYLSKPTATDLRTDLVVMRVDPMETLLETTLPPPEGAGIQRIRLADHGLKLEPGVSYQWLVKLVPDASDRSYDRIVGGGLKRVTPSPELQRKLGEPSTSRPHALAEAGIWYDAIDSLSQRIDAAPGNRTLWNQRAALLEQVGLPEVVLSEQAAAGFGRR